MVLIFFKIVIYKKNTNKILQIKRHNFLKRKYKNKKQNIFNTIFIKVALGLHCL